MDQDRKGHQPKELKNKQLGQAIDVAFRQYRKTTGTPTVDGFKSWLAANSAGDGDTFVWGTREDDSLVWGTRQDDDSLVWGT